MRIKFFHTPKPKQFNYKPRFYDPRQERFDRIRSEAENPEAAEASARFKEQMGRLREREQISRKTRNNNRNLIIAIIMLCMLLYFILK